MFAQSSDIYGHSDFYVFIMAMEISGQANFKLYGCLLRLFPQESQSH